MALYISVDLRLRNLQAAIQFLYLKPS